MTIAWKAFCKCNCLTNARRTDGSTYMFGLGLWVISSLGKFLPPVSPGVVNRKIYMSLYNTAAAGLQRRTDNFNARCSKLFPAVWAVCVRMMGAAAGTHGTRVESHPRIPPTTWGRGGGGGSVGTRVHSHSFKLILRGEWVIWGIQGAGSAACNTVLGPSALQISQSAWGKRKLCSWLTVDDKLHLSVLGWLVIKQTWSRFTLLFIC